MNKKYKQLVPVVFILAIVVFIVVVFGFAKGAISDYTEKNAKAKRLEKELKKASEDAAKAEELKKQTDLKLNSIKQIYVSTVNTPNENLGVFGSMFEDIIKRVQHNGLLIRSIEYDMHPEDDLIYSNYSDNYNVCELKFYLVGSYSQLRSFLNEINNNFEYLVALSKLKITAFESNTDYILINLSINLYSKKPEKSQQNKGAVPLK